MQCKDQRKSNRLVCVSGLRAFETEGKANEVLDGIKQRPMRRGGRPKRVYCCKLCGWWHLTAREKSRSMIAMEETLAKTYKKLP